MCNLPSPVGLLTGTKVSDPNQRRTSQAQELGKNQGDLHLLGAMYYSQAKKTSFIAQLLPIRLISTLSAATAVLAAE